MESATATSFRKLASIAKVVRKEPIKDKDKIERVQVKAWWVIAVKDEFKEGDLVIYLEIDSFVPHSLCPFLSKGKEPSEF